MTTIHTPKPPSRRHLKANAAKAMRKMADAMEADADAGVDHDDIVTGRHDVQVMTGAVGYVQTGMERALAQANREDRTEEDGMPIRLLVHHLRRQAWLLDDRERPERETDNQHEEGK